MTTNDVRTLDSSRPKAGQSRSVGGRIDAAAEWRHWLTGWTLGLLAFETLSGLAIYLLPFSVFNQYGVLLHTVVGVVMVVPVGWYVARHWWRRFRGNLNHYQLLGYVSVASLLVLLVSGFVLTFEACFGVRINYTWDLVHVVGGFILPALLAAHLLTLILRKMHHEPSRSKLKSAYASCWLHTLVSGGGLIAVCWALAAAHLPVDYDDSFPTHYSFKYGVDRPFAPSLARNDALAIETELRATIGSVLNDAQRASFVERLKADPSEHVGVVTVAERLCDEMKLTDEQRSEIRAAAERARGLFKTTGRVDPRRLAGSAGCGTSGCHSEVLEEWEPSAHRYSAMDVVFQRVQTILLEDRDPQVTRYCAGCHDPISLLSGAKNAQNVTLSAQGADEGISCVVCHSISQTDVRGNADYTVSASDPYIYERREGVWAKRVSDFLIRAYPRRHIEAYSKPLYKTTEYCAACHKQYIDEEVNLFGWVQGQNQYDSWRKSRWHREDKPSETIACRDCHMPLVDSTDPASGDLDDATRSPDDGKHRSHRFLAANQFIPLYHELPGAKEHVAKTVKWLRGEFEVPEIAARWTDGPVVRLGIVAPDEIRPGEEIDIQVVLTNNKTGHDFPTGPLDMIESWVELTVTDAAGETVFHNGGLDERGYLVNPNIVLKKELVDRKGADIDRHNLWDAVSARYSRLLYPGFTDTADFRFVCPGMDAESPYDELASGERGSKFAVPTTAKVGGDALTVHAVLWYSKFRAPFMDAVFGVEAGMRAPATAISEATTQIRLVSSDGTASQ